MSRILGYLSVIMLRQSYDFSANPAATSQCSYNILVIFYLLCISERILYLIDDITIILHVTDTRFQRSYNILVIFYFLWISERILYLIDDITIILHVTDTRL